MSNRYLAACTMSLNTVIRQLFSKILLCTKILTSVCMFQLWRKTWRCSDASGTLLQNARWAIPKIHSSHRSSSVRRQDVGRPGILSRDLKTGRTHRAGHWRQGRSRVQVSSRFQKITHSKFQCQFDRYTWVHLYLYINYDIIKLGSNPGSHFWEIVTIIHIYNCYCVK